MRCNNCGAMNADNMQFCTNCGYPLYSMNNKVQPMQKKGSSLKIVLILLILILIIGGILAYIVFFDSSPTEISLLTNDNYGNVLNNPQIATNIEDSEISAQICESAKSGVPIYKIGDGTGPVSIIVAGVHGDQLVPTVAATDIINYLQGRKIKGTVYIIPFASPSALEQNTKYTNCVNLNKAANVEGTVSNKIVNFAVNSNATAVGDFHETEYGKNPGVSTVMCTQYPEARSYQLAKDMSSISKDSTLSYLIAGIEYEGAIEDECNLQLTPAVHH